MPSIFPVADPVKKVLEQSCGDNKEYSGLGYQKPFI